MLEGWLGGSVPPAAKFNLKCVFQSPLQWIHLILGPAGSCVNVDTFNISGIGYGQLKVVKLPHSHSKNSQLKKQYKMLLIHFDVRNVTVFVQCMYSNM